MTIHADWLSLIEVSGAFLAEPVLDIAFPQGLEGFPTHKRQTFRQTYEEWRDAQDNDDELKDQLHVEWINWVLRVGLEWDEAGSEEDLKSQIDLPESLSLSMPEHGLVIKPDYALFGDDKSKPFVIVQTYTADTDLNKVLGSDGWSTSPADRMSHLCKATGVRLGLITNGEQWMLVDAREGNITSYATWYARLWSQEPSTLKSFYSLLNISAFFNGLGLDAKKLSDLLDESLKHQDEVTETLGSQVQRAVEVLIQSLDRINKDKNGELLKGVEPSELYEAGLTYMMRLVFLLCAEERGLLLLGDETYESNYAVSTLRMKLREEAGQHGEEVLGFRNNAWSRLLAVFRAVYGGIEHEELRMPALGGSLFDPDRFPFLEGRPKGSNWRIDAAHPLPIDNRTVLLFLDAIQLFQGRTLSYRALDVEQIGYVYEGLLEKTVIRADDVTLELKATQKSKTPWLKLGELASAELVGEAKVLTLLQDRTGSSASRVKNDYNKPLEPSQSAELLLACNNNTELRNRLLPYFHFLREDALGKPLIYAKNAFIVATGQDRRETGTHYTPKSLTEAVVKETLEPLVYEGPSVGTPRVEWKLKTAEELLDLKVCDPAMGSGAFLVQVVRYLGERVCEAWEQAESDGKAVSVEGVVIETGAGEELLPPQSETEARNLIARRFVAERCIYGADVNPLAVELAKLSIWLVTLSKGRPFGFLDHNLRSGDSLLGVHRIEQLTELSMNPTGRGQQRLFGREIEQAVKDAVELRKRIRSMSIRDIQDVNVIASLDADARSKLQLPELIADAFIANVLSFGEKPRDLEGTITDLIISAEQSVSGERNATEQLQRVAQEILSTDKEDGCSRSPLHWCLEFPEVFSSDRFGFDAVIGNPPFKRGKDLSGILGKDFRNYLINIIANGCKGSADLVVYFLLRSSQIVKPGGYCGMLATKTIAEGDSRKVGLSQLLEQGFDIYNANPNFVWPGKASVVVSRFNFFKGSWNGNRYLNGKAVNHISDSFHSKAEWIPKALNSNSGLAYVGSYPLGQGFTLSLKDAEELIANNPINKDVIYPYLNGRDLNTDPRQNAGRWVINFFDWSEEYARKYKEPFEIVLEKVKPERQERKPDGSFKKRKPLPERWWQYADKRPALYHKIGRGEKFLSHPDWWENDEHQPQRVLVNSQTTKYFNPQLINNESVFDQKLIIFTFGQYSDLAFMNSTPVQDWVWKYSGRQGYGLSLSPENSISNLPFLHERHSDQMNFLGEELHLLRVKIMQGMNIGLTDLYNLYNDQMCHDSAIKELRDIHKKIDNQVFMLFGMSVSHLNHDFYEIESLPANDAIRFTLSSSVRAQVLNAMEMANKSLFELENTSESTNSRKNSSDTKAKAAKNEASDQSVQIGFDLLTTLDDSEIPETQLLGAGKVMSGNKWGSNTIDQILAWLDANKGWFGKVSILNGCGADESEWDTAIAELLKDGDIESRDIDGVVRYRVAE